MPSRKGLRVVGAWLNPASGPMPKKPWVKSYLEQNQAWSRTEHTAPAPVSNTRLKLKSTSTKPARQKCRETTFELNWLRLESNIHSSPTRAATPSEVRITQFVIKRQSYRVSHPERLSVLRLVFGIL